MLPDCLAARLPGTLTELEEIVAVAEQASSLMAAANQLRTDDVSLVSAMRWVQRRVRAVHLNLTVLIGLMPEVFLGLPATVTACREQLGLNALMQCRGLAHRQLSHLAPPLGLQPPGQSARYPAWAHPQPMGPDPKARPP